MTKLRIFIFAVISIYIFQACTPKKKSKEIEQYKNTDTKVQLNEKLQQKVGSWIREGMDCYGIVIAADQDGSIRSIKEIKAEVVLLRNDKIKMKALEKVSLAPKAGCNKMNILKGDTWWEEEGDLFRTQEEARKFIKSYISKHKPANGVKFTVD